MKLATKLGKSYEQSRDQAKIKTINLEIGNARFSLRVRIPLKKQMEEMIEKISSPSPEHVEAIYNKLADPLIKTLLDGGEDFAKAMAESESGIVITDNDVYVQGSSVRQVATFQAMWETKVQEYFHLLQSETGEPITETYDEIAEEFPEPVIKQMVEDIESAIKPDYKTAKKN
jgi:hypothetical protein